MLRIVPTFQEFLKLTRKGNLIPVDAEILADLETPVSSFLKIDGPSAGSFLLESVEGGHSQARYSFLGSDPSVILTAKGDSVTIRKRGAILTKKHGGDPLTVLQKELSAYTFVERSDLPRFCGGAVGFMSYECSRFYEKIPQPKKDALGLPDMTFFIADTLVVFDHAKRKIRVVANAFVPKGAGATEKRKAYDLAVAKINALVDKLRHSRGSGATSRAKKPGSIRLSSNFTKPAFEKAVRRVKEHIRQGDVIQTVISQRFQTPYTCNDFDIYRALRSINPSPYMFYLKCDGFALVGSSPEVHVRCEDGKALLRPIAGTRPRGKDPAEDEKLEKGLLADPKEKAEHVMLVDLGRNDLGRVSSVGSVAVDPFMVIERYSHVMHIVSQVSSELSPKHSVYDVIRATFPAGTVSGAPKVRAMEIISKLEPDRRGAYAGLVGYFGFNGNFDSCITIRTVVLKNRIASVQAGAGIVADSVPAAEWMECHNKARGVLKAIEMAERGLE